MVILRDRGGGQAGNKKKIKKCVPDVDTYRNKLKCCRNIPIGRRVARSRVRSGEEDEKLGQVPPFLLLSRNTNVLIRAPEFKW